METETIRMRAPMRYLIWVPERNRIIGKTQGMFRPKIENDMVLLFGKWYRLDTTKIGVQTIKRFRSLRLLSIDQPIMLWRENDPEPRSFNEIWDDIPMPEYRTGDKIASFIEAGFIKKITGRRPDLIMYIILLALGALIGFVVGTYQPLTDGATP